MSTDASRCEALRIVYNLGWLQPVEPGSGSRNGVGPTVKGEQERGSAAGEADLCRSGGDSGGGRGASGGGAAAAGKRRRDGDDPFREHNPTFPSPRPPPLAAEDSSSGMTVRYTSCPFQKALPLVRSRQVLLRNGRALLSPGQVPPVVVGHLEALLRDGLTVAARGLPAVETDQRVAGVLRDVRRVVDALVYGGGGGSGGGSRRSAVAITRRNIDEVAEKHFPLCMRRTLGVLRREHHLKYQARLQLISFLGNAGMEV